MRARRRRRAVAWIVVLVVVIAGAVVGFLEFVGVPETVRLGAQSQVCGVRLAVTESGDGVTVGWADQRRQISKGERVRVAPWCVVELTSLDAGADATADGSGTAMLRWRLW